MGGGADPEMALRHDPFRTTMDAAEDEGAQKREGTEASEPSNGIDAEEGEEEQTVALLRELVREGGIELYPVCKRLTFRPWLIR